MKMKTKLPVAQHLTDSEYELLLTVYARHNSAMGLEKRKNYTLSNIVKVERNLDKKCLNVHYENGDSWNYLPNRTWFLRD